MARPTAGHPTTPSRPIREGRLPRRPTPAESPIARPPPSFVECPLSPVRETRRTYGTAPIMADTWQMPKDMRSLHVNVGHASFTKAQEKQEDKLKTGRARKAVGVARGGIKCSQTVHPEYALAQDSILHFVVSEIEIRESSAETLNKTVQNTIRVEFGLAISSLCKSLVCTTTGIYFDTLRCAIIQGRRTLGWSSTPFTLYLPIFLLAQIS